VQEPDEVEQRVRADIERHGWHVALVPPEADAPGWGHSIGLWERFQHPELLVFGSEPHQLASLLNALGERVRGGRRFAAGETDAGVLAGLPFAFRAVAPRWTQVFLGNAAWHYRSEVFATLQGFWPDRAGRFPWDADCTPEVAAEQPQLSFAALHEALPERLLATLRRDGAL
jgi:Domain of unknown function (DUF4262)